MVANMPLIKSGPAFRRPCDKEKQFKKIPVVIPGFFFARGFQPFNKHRFVNYCPLTRFCFIPLFC